jgi:hypothetical protein
MRERERERERETESGWVIRDTTLNRGKRAKFRAMKVPRHCPLVLLVKADWRGAKTFGCEEGRDTRWLVKILVKNSVRTSKSTPHFTITKFSWLMLFKEIIAVHTKNHTKVTTIKYRVTYC